MGRKLDSGILAEFGFFSKRTPLLSTVDLESVEREDGCHQCYRLLCNHVWCFSCAVTCRSVLLFIVFVLFNCFRSSVRSVFLEESSVGQVPFLFLFQIDARFVAKWEGRCPTVPEETKARCIRKAASRVECANVVIITSYASFGRMWMTPQFFDRLAACNIVFLPVYRYR